MEADLSGQTLQISLTQILSDCCQTRYTFMLNTDLHSETIFRAFKASTGSNIPLLIYSIQRTKHTLRGLALGVAFVQKRIRRVFPMQDYGQYKQKVDNSHTAVPSPSLLLFEVHHTFTEGQWCAAAVQRRKQSRDEMTYPLSVQAKHRRLCEARITGKAILFCHLHFYGSSLGKNSLFSVHLQQDDLLIASDVHMYYVSCLLFL